MTHLQEASTAVDERALAIAQAGQGMSCLDLARLLASGFDFDASQLVSLAYDAAEQTVQSIRCGEPPDAAIMRAYIVGVTTGAMSQEVRAREAAVDLPPTPAVDQVWQQLESPRIPGMQHRRIRITALWRLGDMDYVEGIVIRGEGAIRKVELQVPIAALVRKWVLVENTVRAVA